jgi:hypothetical protein
MLEKILGGPEKVFTGPDGAGVLVNAAVLARHHPERSVWYPFIQGLIEDPQEIWMSLDEHIATGRVELRKRYVKLLRVGPERRGMFLVAQASKGQLIAWTLVSTDNLRQINKQRVGKLLWRK